VTKYLTSVLPAVGTQWSIVSAPHLGEGTGS